MSIKKIVNRYIITISLLIISSVLIHLLTYSKFEQAENGLAEIQKIPLNIGQWRGKDVPLEKRVYEILETRSIIYRQYASDSGAEVFLEIIYYPETKVDLHGPEGCLAGRGINISKSEKTVRIYQDGKPFALKLNQLIRREPNQDNLIYYFYKAGHFMGPSYLQLRFNLALNKFLSDEKSGALILVSSMNEDNIDNESKHLKKFLQDIFPYLKNSL